MFRGVFGGVLRIFRGGGGGVWLCGMMPLKFAQLCRPWSCRPQTLNPKASKARAAP